ncbi:hypothetical protein ACJX0J_014726, partial [Zea mays]
SGMNLMQGKWLPDADFYKQQAKFLFKNLHAPTISIILVPFISELGLLLHVAPHIVLLASNIIVLVLLQFFFVIGVP